MGNHMKMTYVTAYSCVGHSRKRLKLSLSARPNGKKIILSNGLVITGKTIEVEG